MTLRWIAVFWTALLFLPWSMTTEALPTAADDQAEVVRGNNTFAVDLYKQLSKQEGNLLFSPDSISTALAMAYAGARGETASEMANVLHFMLPQERLHPALGELLKTRNAPHDGYQLREANSLWGQQGYPFNIEFLKLTMENYGGELNQADFYAASEQVRQTINQWVEKQTEKKIKELIAPGILNRNTRLVLTNAVYFKGNWQDQFDNAQTQEDDFHVSSTRIIKTPLMQREGGYNYFDGGSFQAIEIAFKNKGLSTVVFLPKQINGLTSLEQSLTAANLQNWLTQLKPQDALLILPKYRMNAQFMLNETLDAMGMHKAFGWDADFSGMIGQEGQQKYHLFISAVIHQAFIDVNEEGTEAAAATGVVHAMPTIAIPRPIVRADHPYLFLIRDNLSGSIYFMGRVIDPSKEK